MEKKKECKDDNHSYGILVGKYRDELMHERNLKDKGVGLWKCGKCGKHVWSM